MYNLLNEKNLLRKQTDDKTKQDDEIHLSEMCRIKKNK